MRLLGNECAQIILWDEATQRLRFGAAIGPEAERVRNQTWELGRGVNGAVAVTREPIILYDYQASPYALPEFPDVVATITTPVLFGERLLGVTRAILPNTAVSATFSGMVGVYGLRYRRSVRRSPVLSGNIGTRAASTRTDRSLGRQRERHEPQALRNVTAL